MLFNRLDADVLSHIFALTDVYTILSLSQVNKYFHEISSTKHLWISVVRGLSLRRLIDAPPDEVLETLSKDALVDEVRRAVNGPSTPLQTLQLFLVKPSSHCNANTGMLNSSQAEHISSFLSLVWSWERPGLQAREAKFDFRAGESEGIVSLVVSTRSAVHGTSYKILVLGVNLTTGDSHDLFHLPTDAAFPSDMQMSGEFLAFRAAVDWFNLTSFVVLVNWRTADVIVFDLMRQEPNFSLLPDHILLVYPGSARGMPDHLRLYSISSLSRLWRPMNRLDLETDIETANLEGIPFVSCNIPASNLIHGRSHNVSLSVVTSPVHDAAYDCVVELVTYGHQHASPPPQPPSLLERLRSRLMSRPTISSPSSKVVTRVHFILSFPSPHILLKSVVHHGKDLPFTARSRYNFFVFDGLPVVVYGRDETEVAHGRDLPGIGDASHVRLVHSGAVLALYRSQAVVSYYR
ncbi:hypothetical protein MVEN_01702800 [Mycena venus]|uniref:F-box domain-containing protein n=1 Tax=Mycena venus TaxID=2733690 RepID=A0A8H7CQU1_9AGAR|nr:hypothetical protein MVEN_01702800 [Mycena venus]